MTKHQKWLRSVLAVKPDGKHPDLGRYVEQEESYALGPNYTEAGYLTIGVGST